MEKTNMITDKTLNALLAGKHPLAKTYGGKQVFVIEKEIVPVSRGKKAMEEFKKLKERYGTAPVLVFVPQPGTSYILIAK